MSDSTDHLGTFFRIPPEPFEPALPRRTMSIIMLLMVPSLWALSTGITIAGIWTLVRLIGRLL